MKISVGCHSHPDGRAPSCLCLGQRRLPVTNVLQSRDENAARVYEVRVLDGRRFVVRRQIEMDRWELIAVYDREPKDRSPSRIKPALAALLLIMIALSRKTYDFARRLRHPAASDLPKGGAAA